jgi:hypothetical protein
MNRAPTHRAFFGDAEHDFALTAPLILELERKTSTGIYALGNRVFAGHCSLADVTETIRLAMIGGGTDPEEAQALVSTYTTARPIIHAYMLAVEILTLTLNGPAAGEDAGDDNAGDDPEGTEADDLDQSETPEPTP